MSLRLASLAAATLAVLAAAPARAQVPNCDGHDPSAAAAHAEAAERMLRDAVGRGSAADRRTAGESALRELDAQCACGDDTALLGRALAYLALGQRMESALSLDAFLGLHDPATLDATTQRRVNGNLAAGSVTVDAEGTATDVRLFVDGFDFGALPRSRPVHLPYGEHALEARRGTTIVANERATLDTSTTEARVHFAIGDAPVEPPHVEPPPPPIDPVVVRPASTRTDFVPWYVLSGSVAAVGVGVGIGFLVGADERARTYNSGGCAGAMPPPNCGAVASEHDTFSAVAVAALVTGGLGLAALAIVGVLDLNQPRRSMRIGCLPTFGGVACAGELW